MNDDFTAAEQKIVRLFSEADPAPKPSAPDHAIHNGQGVVVVGDNAQVTVNVTTPCPGCRHAASYARDKPRPRKAGPMRPTLAPVILVGALVSAEPAAAQWTSRYEDLGYLTTRAYVLASACGYVIDDGVYLDWMRTNIPPEARPAFRVGSSRAGDEIKHAYGLAGLAALYPQDSGLRSPPPEWTALLNACPDLRAAAESLGLLAAP